VKFLVFLGKVKDTVSIDNTKQNLQLQYSIIISSMEIDTNGHEYVSLAFSPTSPFLIKMFLRNILQHDFLWFWCAIGFFSHKQICMLIVDAAQTKGK
jgi:hypothetical protein